MTHLIPITMQIQIRKSGGGDVSLEDCAGFTEPMEKALETSELLNDAYVLEISSPGISDQLLSDRDFQTFRGFPVEVTYKDESNSEQLQTGLLHKRSINDVQLNIKGRISKIRRNYVTGVKLISPTG